MRKKMFILFAAVLAIVTLLSGCGFKDIDKRFIVVGIGIDKPEDGNKKYKITLKLAIPSPQERFGSNKYTLVVEENDSIAEAVRIAKAKVDKELDFGHAKAILFGKELVETEDMGQVIDWFIRRRDIQKVAWVAAGDPDSFSILNVNPPTERLPSNMIFLSFGQTGTETAYIVSEYLFDFRRRLKERGLDPILPIIKLREEEQFTIDRVMLLDKKRAKLTLSPRETKIFNSFHVNSGKYDIKIPGGENKFFVISADDVTGKYTFEKRGGQNYIKVNMRINGVIEETNMNINENDLGRLEKMTEKTVNQRVEAFLVKLQKEGVDPIGFGLRYRARHFGPEERVWKEWQGIYPGIKFDVHTHVKLTSTGVLK
ncbi:Ger(x)C family spore germination protein [Paenibacillus thermotolerans]|uniref:Ger(x)C family spore germination protein n=1 Tax=Paenibacillus thermotolerans TaxID=3027807 RepID=UPI002367EB12|nr:MULTISPECIES: Ger(x)C family spore germination protein [unclassified Paenibacillus]